MTPDLVTLIWGILLLLPLVFYVGGLILWSLLRELEKERQDQKRRWEIFVLGHQGDNN